MLRAGPQPAFVLHHWAWSETSLILDLFTRELGRVAVVAKGAKRPYSQLRSVLLPFQRVLVTLGRPRADANAQTRLHGQDGGDILTLRTAEFAGGAPALPAACLFAGFYVNELLQKLLARNDAHQSLFDAYADTLIALARDGGAGEEAALRAFELRLLHETGVLPELNRNTQTQEALAAERGYMLSAESGLLPSRDAASTMSATQCLALHQALQAPDADALREACRGALPALKVQLRAMLHYHLGSPHLRTRQAMLDVRRLLDETTQNAAP